MADGWLNAQLGAPADTKSKSQFVRTRPMATTTPLATTVDFRRLYVRVLGARDLQLGGGGTLTVLVTTGAGKYCRAESEAAQAVAAPSWQFETSLGLPAVGKPPLYSDSEAMVQFSVHRRHFLATEVVGSAAVRVSALKGAYARDRTSYALTMG